MGDGGPSNLNPIQYDQDVDRKRRFRPSEQAEIAMDGMGGDLNQFRGPGTENQTDTGSSPSGVFAGWSRRRSMVEQPEPTMPNAKKESDPQEEGMGSETNQAFYDMQQR